jgi:hypothetical protein
VAGHALFEAELGEDAECQRQPTFLVRTLLVRIRKGGWLGMFLVHDGRMFFVFFEGRSMLGGKLRGDWVVIQRWGHLEVFLRCGSIFAPGSNSATIRGSLHLVRIQRRFEDSAALAHL